MSSNTPDTPQAPEGGLVKVPEALVMLKIGRTKLNEMMNSDEVHRVKIGRATRITMASIKRLVGEG